MTIRKNTPFGAFTVFNHDSIGEAIEKEFWEEWTRPYFDGIPADTGFIDVGANYGFYTVYMARKGHQTWAFEPAPQIYPLLLENVRINGLADRVTAHDFPLWNESGIPMVISDLWLGKAGTTSRLKFASNGEIDFDNIPNSGGMSIVPGMEASAHDRLQRHFLSKTLDDYQLWKSPTRIGLIKVDAQGADVRVLQGARETIKQTRPWILFEYEPDPAMYIGDTLEMAHAFIDEIGYRYEVLHSAEPNWRQFGLKPL